MISITMMLCIKFHFLTAFCCVQNGFVKYYVLSGAGTTGLTAAFQWKHSEAAVIAFMDSY